MSNPMKTRSFTPLAGASLLLILLLAAVMRLAYPGTVEFKHDEATLSLLALDWVRGGSFPLTGMPSSVGVPNAPASVYVMALPFALGADALAATMFVALLNVAGVGLLWLLAHRYFGFVPALVAGLAYALSPWAVLYSRKIWAQDFHTPFVLLALLLGLYGFTGGKRWAQVLCLPLMLFALQIHFAAWALLPLCLWLLLIGGRRVSLPALAASLILAGLVMLPFAAGIIHTLEHEPDRIANALGGAGAGLTVSEEALVYHIALATGAGIEAETAPGARLPLAGLTSLWLVVMGAALLIGLLAARRYGWRWAGLLWLWALLPLLVFSLTWTAVYPHYFIASIPALCLLMGIGVDALARRLPFNRLTCPLLIGAFCLLPLAQGLHWREIIAYVDSSATPGGFGTPLRYLLAVRDQLTADRDVLVLTDGIEIRYDQEPAIWSALLYDTADCVRALAGDGRALFPAGDFAVLTAPNAPPHPVNDLYASGMEQVIALRPGEGAYRIARFGAQPLWTAPLMTPVEPVAFDHGARFTGYHLMPDRVYLEWRFDGPGQHDDQFFVHLLDTGGERIAQHDGRFWPGRYWCAGDRLLIWADMPVPDETRTLRVGLYTLVSGGFVNARVLDAAGNPVGVWADVVVE